MFRHLLCLLQTILYTGYKISYPKPLGPDTFGNRNFSDFGMVVRGIRGQELSESIAQLISTSLIGKYCSLRCLF
jgi:hypothetical protein